MRSYWRESLEETGGDIRHADPDHLAVAVDLSPERSAKTEAVEMVSVRATRAIPSAPDQQWEIGYGPNAWHRQWWEPLGKGPDKRDTMGAKSNTLKRRSRRGPPRV